MKKYSKFVVNLMEMGLKDPYNLDLLEEFRRTLPKGHLSFWNFYLLFKKGIVYPYSIYGSGKYSRYKYDYTIIKFLNYFKIQYKITNESPRMGKLNTKIEIDLEQLYLIFNREDL